MELTQPQSRKQILSQAANAMADELGVHLSRSVKLDSDLQHDVAVRDADRSIRLNSDLPPDKLISALRRGVAYAAEIDRRDSLPSTIRYQRV